MSEEYKVETSPLSQMLSSGNKTVQIDIYSGEDEDGWVLEIQDEHGNSSIWDELFATDQEALTEAKKEILAEGINHFIGPVGGKGEWIKGT
ncbi:MAG: hypothetical protein HRU38_03770 [Saccharospirillaceae bacterium]|nr:hypothetical protein [Pseudomonadales bacterium]NRB77782.1 hypothetical protein [Saccharospirillaceae bacterium]